MTGELPVTGERPPAGYWPPIPARVGPVVAGAL